MLKKIHTSAQSPGLVARLVMRRSEFPLVKNMLPDVSVLLNTLKKRNKILRTFVSADFVCLFVNYARTNALQFLKILIHKKYLLK